MGVSGSGKSTVGKLLAERIGGFFMDGDDLHSAVNIKKMKHGIPLDDTDRWPWLDSIVQTARERMVCQPVVVACSALKESYRQILLSAYDGAVEWVTLFGDEALLRARLDKREGHFVGANLLTSQLRDFEVPDYGHHFDIEETPVSIVDNLLARLDAEKVGN